MIDTTYLSIKDAIEELKAQKEHINCYMSIVGTTAYDMGIEALEDALQNESYWIWDPDTLTYMCKNCDEDSKEDYLYCPYCGKKMEGVR